MSGLARTLRHRLRDVRLAREAVVRLRLLSHRPAASDGVIFLFYHGVPPRDRARFARQLRRLRDFGDLVSLSDAIALLADGANHGRQICLTFDDGYRDAFDNALPILVEAGAPAAFFVISGWIDEAREDVIGWDECRDLVRSGMEVGSHTVTHRRLSTLSEPEAAAELQASRARIETELGQPCRHFACPFGQPDADYRPDREPALARAAGYRSFFTTIPRRAAASADPWRLPRVRMEPGWSDAELRHALLR